MADYSRSISKRYSIKESVKSLILGKKITNLLQQIVNDNGLNMKYKSLFAIKDVTSISLQKYIERIIKYLKMEESTLIISLIYIDRICKETEFELNKSNIHKYIYKLIKINLNLDFDCNKIQ